MAKEPKEQKTMDEVVEPVSRRVKDAARKLAKNRHTIKELQEDQVMSVPALNKIMLEDGVEKVEVSFTFGEGDKAETINSEVKRSEIAATFKITCKKLGGDSE